MAQPGDTVEIPATGERFVFLQTSAETGGELLELEFHINPGGFSARPHVHWDVEERVKVVSGKVILTISGEERVLGPGESAVVPMKQGHMVEVAGDEQAVFVVQVAPARHFEELFETIFGLYRDGKISADGRGNLLQDAVISRRHNSFLAGPPIFAQRPVLAVLALVGWLFGFRARYERYSGPDS
ncbi:MAG: cupin domain-containing protein [Chloroflexi bacterium]|nr:cupin domain-containing protein [Chloroflexota bacterium]